MATQRYEPHAFLQFPVGHFRDPKYNNGTCWYVVSHRYCGLPPADEVHRVATEPQQADTVSEARKPKYIPPLVIRMAFCATCGQNNLVRPLKDKHYAGGKLCAGVLTIIGYTRKEHHDNAD